MNIGKNSIHLCVKALKRRIKYFPPVKVLLENRLLSGSSVFMLHRCAPYETDKLLPNEILKVSPEYLDSVITKLKKTHDIISIDEAYASIQSGKGFRRRVAVFTFDDGYKDNAAYALPVFEHHSVPFTVYVTPCFPDFTANLWWFALEEIVCTHETVTTADGMIYSCRTRQEKIDSYMTLRAIILKMNPETIADKFTCFFSTYTVDLHTQIQKFALSWDEVKKLAASPLCTIGAHTVNHVNLHELSDESAFTEITESRRILEEKINKPVLHFAFPFGTAQEVTSREIELVKKAGFHTSVLSYGGTFSKTGTDNALCLPRKMIQDVYHEF